MFHFPTFPPHTLYIQMRVTTHDMSRGSPIRTPSDHRSFTNSPRLIAGYNVLHRLLMPRHPPCALEHSHTPPRSRNHAPGASESDNTRNTTTKSHRTPHTHICAQDAQMLASTIRFSNNQQTPPRTPTRRPARQQDRHPQKNTHPQTWGPVLPGPNSVSVPHPPAAHRPPTGRHHPQDPKTPKAAVLMMFHP